jgi:AraC-like DNA-binding protein
VNYIQRTPAPPLDRFVRMLWYIDAANLPVRRERILPQGCVHVVINLDRDFNWECSDEARIGRLPASLVVGARSVYEIVDTSDMAHMAGMLFQPGGFASFAGDGVDRFSNGNFCLTDIWGRAGRSLRESLLEAGDGPTVLDSIEEFLLNRFAPKLCANPMIDYALRRFTENPAVASVRDVAREMGRSERYLSQVFRESVGLTPKAWCRVQRFQRVVRQLHAGVDVPWAELAIDCGYYDQSHFANEFRAFSGIDASTYSARRTQWANHIPID